MTDLPPAPPPPPAAPVPARSGVGTATKVTIGVVAAAVLVGGGVGAYAVYDKLDGGGPQPHDVLPASTDAYLRLDLDPSASQKVDLFRLIRRFPEAAKQIGIKNEDQDIRELVFKDVLASECDDLDYEADVEPWLGERVGVGFDVDDNSVVVAVQTTDEKKSRAGIKKLFACGDETYGIAFLDGYAILAPQQKDVDTAVAAAKKSTLGDKASFVDDFDQLGNQGVASGWADLAAIAEVPELVEAGKSQAKELAKAGSVAMTLRVDGSTVELAALGGPAASDDAVKGTTLADLPKDTVAALSVSGVGKQVTDGFDELMTELEGDTDPSVVPTIPAPAAPEDPTGTPYTDDLGGLDDDYFKNDDLGAFGGFSARGMLDEFEQQTGLKVPEDLATLFGDNLTLALGAKNLETIPSLSGPEGLTSLDLAMALTSDPAAALDLVQRLATLAGDAGVPMVASPTDDGAVLATNQGAADAVTQGDGALGDSKVFRSVIPNGDSTAGGFYLDVGTILDKLLEADPPQDVRDVIEEAQAISAVGVSVSSNDDRPLTSLRVAFDR